MCRLGLITTAGDATHRIDRGRAAVWRERHDTQDNPLRQDARGSWDGGRLRTSPCRAAQASRPHPGGQRAGHDRLKGWLHRNRLRVPMRSSRETACFACSAGEGERPSLPPLNQAGSSPEAIARLTDGPTVREARRLGAEEVNTARGELLALSAAIVRSLAQSLARNKSFVTEPGSDRLGNS